jgi:hypothetical protein
MKRQWRVRQQTCARPDGQRRWDQAYQVLLAWAASGEDDLSVGDESPATERQGAHANRHVCARLDDAPGGGPEH